ncbi:hypothetical protein ES703_66469 [subsurface metagenome]
MKPQQREQIKTRFRDNVLLYKLGHYHPIPEALLRLMLHEGISLRSAKEIFTECALQNEDRVYLSRGSFQVIFSSNIEGQRGKNRMLKWYPKVRGFYRTHFIARDGTGKEGEG